MKIKINIKVSHQVIICLWLDKQILKNQSHAGGSRKNKHEESILMTKS